MKLYKFFSSSTWGGYKGGFKYVNFAGYQANKRDATNTLNPAKFRYNEGRHNARFAARYLDGLPNTTTNFVAKVPEHIQSDNVQLKALDQQQLKQRMKTGAPDPYRLGANSVMESHPYYQSSKFQKMKPEIDNNVKAGYGPDPRYPGVNFPHPMTKYNNNQPAPNIPNTQSKTTVQNNVQKPNNTN